MDRPLLGFSTICISILVYSLRIPTLSVFNFVIGIFYVRSCFASNCLRVLCYRKNIKHSFHCNLSFLGIFYHVFSFNKFTLQQVYFLLANLLSSKCASFLQISYFSTFSILFINPYYLKFVCYLQFPFRIVECLNCTYYVKL